MFYHFMIKPLSAEETEAFSNLLTVLGAESIEISSVSHEISQEIYEPPIGTTPLWEQNQITALFNDAKACQAAQTFFNKNYPEFCYAIKEIAEENWVSLQRQHCQPIQCGQRLWIYPTWQQVPAHIPIVLRLDPGLAFGTGSHPTTFLCLRWLDSQDLTDKIIIDYGCGSGILAVAAALLGAKEVWATDIDPQALIATKQNAETNQVGQKINITAPEKIPLHHADMIIANILARPLVELAPHFSDLGHKKSLIALSGFLHSEISMIDEAYKPFFQKITLHEMKEKDVERYWQLWIGKK